MKRFFTIFCAAASMCYSSCSRSDVTEDPVPNDTRSQTMASLHEAASEDEATAIAADRVFLAECGYDTSDLVVLEDTYHIGSELLFHKSYVRACRRAPQPRLEFERILAPAYREISLFHSGMSPDDKQHFLDAVEAWNAVENCTLDFNTQYDEDYVSRTAQTTVSMLSFSDISLIQVEDPPLQGRPAGKLSINTGHPLWAQLSALQRKCLIMHGLGHVIGLGHRPADDSNPSIMESESGLAENPDLWYGITNWDAVALQKKYPLFYPPHMAYGYQPQPKGAHADSLLINTTYTITTGYRNPTVSGPASYVYTITPLDLSTEFDYGKRSDSTLMLRLLSPGACKLTVQVFVRDREIDVYEKVFYALDNEFIYPEEVSFGSSYDFIWQFWSPNTSSQPYVTFTVKEKYFDNNTDRSVTIERIFPNHVSIRFNDYGSYEVTASIEAGMLGTLTKTFYFTKLYRPDAKLNVDSFELHSDYTLPGYATEPTGFHPWRTDHCSVDFGTTSTLSRRLVCDVQMEYIQNTFRARRVDHRVLPGPPVRLVLPRGASSHQILPDVYEMYHPDSVNYKDHTTAVKQYYTKVTYPEPDGSGLR